MKRSLFTFASLSVTGVWQEMVKRNLCTLKMAEYQVMYCHIADGLATGKELAELREMRATQKFT